MNNFTNKIYFLKMKKIFLFQIIILVLLPSILCEKKKKKKSLNQTQKIEKEQQIPSILKWAKNNNIYINENLILNKNTDLSHNFFYFTSNSSIPKDTLLLKVPYDMMISQYTLNKYFQETKNKKWYNLWNEIVDNNNEYISHFLTKQLFYISIIIENAINKKKGIIYKKFGPYFDMYEYINMDNFPAFYDDDEIYFLSVSGFGNELTKAVESLKEESYIINNDLKISTSMTDSFLKYRVLTMANSISYNNTDLKKENNEDYNETILVPFIDCFKKVISDKAATAEYSIKKDKNNSYYLEVRSIKKINKRDEINLQWLKLSNQDCLLFYGFIEYGNEYAPAFYVNVFNNLLKKDLGIDKNKDFSDVAKRDLYELNSEFIESDVVQSYKNISNLIDKYKNKKEGRYEMMVDNLNYYLRIYDEQFTDGNINLYIRGIDKQRAIKELMKLEKKILQNKINYIKLLIQDIKEKKYNMDDL